MAQVVGVLSLMWESRRIAFSDSATDLGQVLAVSGIWALKVLSLNVSSFCFSLILLSLSLRHRSEIFKKYLKIANRKGPG